MKWHRQVVIGLLAFIAMAAPAGAIPFEVWLDIAPDGGQVESGAVAIPAAATPANNAGNTNLPTTTMDTFDGDYSFTVAIDKVNAAGSSVGAIDWRDRGNAGTDLLTRLAEDFVKNNAGIVRITLGDLPADTYAVTSYHVDPDNTQCEAIKVLVQDAVYSAFTDTGAVGNALVGGGGVGNLTTAKVNASSATFYVTSNGSDPVSILFDGSAASDPETPVNGLWVRPGTAPPPPPRLITSVTRTGSNLDPMPPVVVNLGLREDALAFVDRTHEWNDLPSAHPELDGADYVRIANDDRSANPFRLKVGLAQNATVYVFKDDRVTQPDMNKWLTAYGFQDTTSNIGMDENGNGNIERYASVYWGNFPAGAVDLFQQNQGGTNMYGVAAVEGRLAPSAHAYTPLGTGKTFLEQEGRVVVEAENYCSRASDGVHDWLVVPTESAGAGTTVLSSARGEAFVQCMPDSGQAGLGPTDAPSIEYQMQISTPGTYRAYLRWDGNATSGTTQGQSDSLFVDIKELKDGTGGTIADWYALNHTLDGNFNTVPWDGTGEKEENPNSPDDSSQLLWTFDKPGIYTIRVSQREDGATLDAIILQLSSLSAPSGGGPGESEFSNGTPLGVKYSKLGGDWDDYDATHGDTHPLGIASGLVEGAPAYVDASGTWTHIPERLLGADYIRTENDDAGYSFTEYSVITDRDAFLYIFLDDAYIAAYGMPQWMLDMGLADVALDVLLDDYYSFSIFQMSIAGDTPISLYGLEKAGRFYGIVVSNNPIVPEPATMALLGLGVLALARRRRRQAS